MVQKNDIEMGSLKNNTNPKFNIKKEDLINLVQISQNRQFAEEIDEIERIGGYF